MIPDHDADAFKSPPNPNLRSGFFDKAVGICFGGFSRWDGQYFLHIAEYGYTHENTLAFFPLYPIVVRMIADMLMVPLHFLLNYHSVLILSSFIINWFLFVNTCKIFYELSKSVLQDCNLAYMSTVLFCFNPASIFFSASYSESIFSFCTLSALLNYEKGGGYVAPILFGLGGAARSNGLINLGFVIYHKLRHGAAYYYG